MFKKKCKSCAEKVERSFRYCPHCGGSLLVRDEKRDFGLLGQDNSARGVQEELKLPFGMDKMIGGLIKQLEKQMNQQNPNASMGMPRGFKVKISTGQPQMNEMTPERKPEKVDLVEEVSEKEVHRRMLLPKIEAESKVRRLADRIVYEILTPGVKKRQDVVLTKLASGLEIKAYSKDKCYVKFIPLTVEVIGYNLSGEKLFLELKA